MNIAMIVPSLANKGPIIVVHDLCQKLIQKGHTCHIFYFDDIIEIDMPCTTQKIKFSEKINFSDWDIVHSHMLRPDAWVWLHKPWFKAIKTKFVTTIHQYISETLRLDYGSVKGRAGAALWKFFLHRQNNIAVLTAEHLSMFGKKLQKKTTVIHNGRDIDQTKEIDTEDINKIEQLKRRYKIIGTTSIVTKRKGLEQIIQSLPLLPDYAYIIVGDGPEIGNLQQLAERLQVNERCLWLYSKPNGYRYTKHYDIYVIPSRSEGFPLSLIEAAALAKPTICADIPIFRTIVKDQEVSFFQLDDIASLVATVNRTYQNRDQEAKGMLTFYHKNLTANIMCSNYIHFYTMSSDDNSKHSAIQ